MRYLVTNPLPFLITRLFSNRLIIYDLLNSSLHSTNVDGGLLDLRRENKSRVSTGSSYTTIKILYILK